LVPLSSFVASLLPHATDLRLEDILLDDPTHLTVQATAIQDTAACPDCAQPTSRVHSYYTRTLSDLPWAVVAVRLQLRVRKFFCPNPACPRRIFTERLPAVMAPPSRRTTRLADHQRHIGLALGGAAGARLGATLDQGAFRTTLLQLVRTTPRDDPPTPHLLSIDDFALCKGQQYGSILVDLERGSVIDLLPDRSAESFADWLQQHPGVEVISRDRAGTYAEGAAQGAPNAVQVADRWHLLKNLADTLTDVLAAHQDVIAQTLGATSVDPLAAGVGQAAEPSNRSGAVNSLTRTETSAGTTAVRTDDTSAVEAAPVPPRSRRQAAQEQRRTQRMARYTQLVELRRAGWTISAIADEVGLDRATVRKYLDAPTFPERQPRMRRRSTILDPFKPYILERWNAGCHTAMQILRELEQRGYRGGRTSVLAFLTQLRQAAGLPPKKRTGVRDGPISDPSCRPPTARSLTWAMVRKPREGDEGDVQLRQLRQTNALLDTTISLAQEFAAIIRDCQHEKFDSWLARAEQSGVRALVSFAAGVRRDYAAVKAAVTLPWSNGPTEGHINRLKLLKRQTYGRAKLDLLRERVLAA
jgi:transposase